MRGTHYQIAVVASTLPGIARQSLTAPYALLVPVSDSMKAILSESSARAVGAGKVRTGSCPMGGLGHAVVEHPQIDGTHQNKRFAMCHMIGE